MVLIQPAWYPGKRGNEDTRTDTGIHTQGDDYVKRQQEGSHLQAKGASGENKPADNLILDFRPAEL